jgi:hypothetical protein
VIDGTTMIFDGMTTVIVVDLTVEPLVPVTVIVYVPVAACGPTEMKRNTLIDCPDVRVTLVLEKVSDTFEEGELLAVSVTVPANEPWLVTVITEVNLDLPFWLGPMKKLGLALILNVSELRMNVTWAA